MAITREISVTADDYTFTCKKKDIPNLPTENVPVNSKAWIWDSNKVYVFDDDNVWSPTGVEKP